MAVDGSSGDRRLLQVTDALLTWRPVMSREPVARTTLLHLPSAQLLPVGTEIPSVGPQLVRMPLALRTRAIAGSFSCSCGGEFELTSLRAHPDWLTTGTRRASAGTVEGKVACTPKEIACMAAKHPRVTEF